MESSPPRKTGGQFYWTSGDLKYSPTSRGLSPMAGLKFSIFFLGGEGDGRMSTGEPRINSNFPLKIFFSDSIMTSEIVLKVNYNLACL